MTFALDNPVWQSLRTLHAGLALRHGEILRYPPRIAPFLGVPAAGVDAAVALDALVGTGDSVYLLGPAPAEPATWRLQALGMLAQMVCDARIEADGNADIVELDERRRDDVLALTALVYPHYFRERTMALGRYFGIYEHGRLAAMIGERMGMDGFREISAVCTHPDCGGRGHARRLLAFLSNDNLDRGRLPFLHVSRDNVRALRLYERAGYRFRGEIAFWSLQRAVADRSAATAVGA